MFYPELKNTLIYKLNNSLIEEFDIWLGTLHCKQSDRISATILVDRFDIDYDIAVSLLEECARKKIMQQRFGILCPDCNILLKIVEDNDVYDIVNTKALCYSCDCESYITDDDMVLLYKVIKKPSGSITKELNRYKAKNACSYDNEIKLSQMVKENLYNPDKLLYCPTSDERKKLKQYYNDVFNTHCNTAKQGATLEYFTAYLFSLVKSFKVTTDLRQLDCKTQIDCTVKNKLVINNPDAVNNSTEYSIKSTVTETIGSIFYIECKNEKTTPKNQYFHKIYSLVSECKGMRVGILVSIEPPASTYYPFARTKYLSEQEECYILSISREDLERIVFYDENLLTLLDFKIDAIRLNFSEDKYRDNPMYTG